MELNTKSWFKERFSRTKCLG